MLMIPLHANLRVQYWSLCDIQIVTIIYAQREISYTYYRMPLPTPRLMFHDGNTPCISASESRTCLKVQDQILVHPIPTLSLYFTRKSLTATDD
jgi:hypothetical protein